MYIFVKMQKSQKKRKPTKKQNRLVCERGMKERWGPGRCHWLCAVSLSSLSSLSVCTQQHGAATITRHCLPQPVTVGTRNTCLLASPVATLPLHLPSHNYTCRVVITPITPFSEHGTSLVICVLDIYLPSRDLKKKILYKYKPSKKS